MSYILAVMVMTIMLTVLFSLQNDTSDPRLETNLTSLPWTHATPCMCCQGCPTYSPTQASPAQAASFHYARSLAYSQSIRGMDTFLLPNRPAVNEAGGSEPAAAWAGSQETPLA